LSFPCVTGTQGSNLRTPRGVRGTKTSMMVCAKHCSLRHQCVKASPSRWLLLLLLLLLLVPYPCELAFLELCTSHHIAFMLKRCAVRCRAPEHGAHVHVTPLAH
jgi:hypothetical protein